MSMPMRKAILPGGGQVVLDPKWRTFRLADGSKQLISVSKVLGKYFPFDEKKVSEFVAMKSGSTVEAVKAEWRKSAHLGTNVHAALESTMKGEKIPSFHEKHGDEELFIPVALDALREITKHYDIIANEAIVASKKCGIAGTVDFIAKHRTTGRLLIGDWKTSSSALSSFRFGSFQTPADGLLSHLPNAKGCRSALQVLLLGYIMQTDGYEAIYGRQVHNEIDYTIVNIGKNEHTGKICSVFEKVTPSDIVPSDLEVELSPQDIIRSIISVM